MLFTPELDISFELRVLVSSCFLTDESRERARDGATYLDVLPCLCSVLVLKNKIGATNVSVLRSLHVLHTYFQPISFCVVALAVAALCC